MYLSCICMHRHPSIVYKIIMYKHYTTCIYTDRCSRRTTMTTATRTVEGRLQHRTTVPSLIVDESDNLAAGEYDSCLCPVYNEWYYSIIVRGAFVRICIHCMFLILGTGFRFFSPAGMTPSSATINHQNNVTLCFRRAWRIYNKYSGGVCAPTLRLARDLRSLDCWRLPEPACFFVVVIMFAVRERGVYRGYVVPIVYCEEQQLATINTRRVTPPTSRSSKTLYYVFIVTSVCGRYFVAGLIS